ncbi:MAG: ABC transporter permease [Actinobacteria bacterium]|nr:ABC transporter permease [Actinomycetota bacterium]
MSLGFCIVTLLLCFPGAPLVARVLGHGPNDPFPYAVSVYQKPAGFWAHVPALHSFADAREYDAHPTAPPGTPQALLPLGGDGPLGRDLALRLLYGGRVTLEVALGGTLLAALIGFVFGASAALAGGWIDALITRLTEFVMAFPLLLLLIMIGSTSVGDKLSSLTLHGIFARGVVQLILVISAFTWFYPARVVRAQVLAIREAEFIAAAEMLGAGQARIVRTHLLPHVIPPLIAYCTAAFATNVMLEAGVSFLGSGIKLPTASWGSILSANWGSLLNPTIDLGGVRERSLLPTLAPTLAIFLVVYAANQVADGVRYALDPAR